MKLILTSYVSSAPDEVNNRIAESIEAAVGAADGRLRNQAPAVATEHLVDGMRIRTDVPSLDGATVEWTGTDRLTELRVVVPWSSESRERKTLAASRFAAALSAELQAA